MFRWHHDDVPHIFKNLFKPVGEVHAYGTRQSNQLYCRDINTNLGRSKLSYRLVKYSELTPVKLDQ